MKPYSPKDGWRLAGVGEDDRRRTRRKEAKEEGMDPSALVPERLVFWENIPGQDLSAQAPVFWTLECRHMGKTVCAVPNGSKRSKMFFYIFLFFFIVP